MIYSVRNASIGLTLIALFAGIKPANNPDTTNIKRSTNTTPKLTLGFNIISTGPTESNKAFIP